MFWSYFLCVFPKVYDPPQGTHVFTWNFMGRRWRCPVASLLSTWEFYKLAILNLESICLNILLLCAVVLRLVKEMDSELFRDPFSVHASSKADQVEGEEQPFRFPRQAFKWTADKRNIMHCWSHCFSMVRCLFVRTTKTFCSLVIRCLRHSSMSRTKYRTTAKSTQRWLNSIDSIVLVLPCFISIRPVAGLSD